MVYGVKMSRLFWGKRPLLTGVFRRLEYAAGGDLSHI